jgi:GTPase SAR1 family protein
MSTLRTSGGGLKSSSQASSMMTFKTILLGDSGVGKTSLFVRLTQDNYSEELPSTLQMDIGRKVITVRPRVDDFEETTDQCFEMTAKEDIDDGAASSHVMV